MGMALGSCGGSSKAPVALDDFAAEAMAAQCDVLVRCHLLEDVDICLASVDRDYSQVTFNSMASIIASARAGKIDYDPAKARACLDQVRNAACNQPTPIVVDRCGAAFRGKLADGEHCIATAACSGPLSYCDYLSACDGVCTPVPNGGCQFDWQCRAGQVCDAVNNVIACTSVVAPGGLERPCGSHFTCQPGLYCTPIATPTGDAMYACKAAAHAGEPCDAWPGSCADGLVCREGAAARTCMTPAGLGDSCETFIQCGGLSLGCDPTTHTCVALPASGPCVGGGFQGCDFRRAYCDLVETPPTCKPLVGAGEPCINGEECGLFTGATCMVAPGATATTCVPAEVCTL